MNEYEIWFVPTGLFNPRSLHRIHIDPIQADSAQAAVKKLVDRYPSIYNEPQTFYAGIVGAGCLTRVDYVVERTVSFC